jgi:hypothetical protein
VAYAVFSAVFSKSGKSTCRLSQLFFVILPITFMCVRVGVDDTSVV